MVACSPTCRECKPSSLGRKRPGFASNFEGGTPLMLRPTHFYDTKEGYPGLSCSFFFTESGPTVDGQHFAPVRGRFTVLMHS